MNDGGYANPMLWLSDGGAMVQTEGWQAPGYWQERDGAWHQFTLGGLRPVEGQQHQLLVQQGQHRQAGAADEGRLDHLGPAHVEDPAEEQRTEIGRVARPTRHDHDADGEERGDDQCQSGVDVDLVPAAGQRHQQRHGQSGGGRRPGQQRPPDGVGDGDPRKDGVLDGIGYERQAAQADVDPDHRAQRA